ncbi:MAG: hypothetical protein R3B74_06365 [Nitrospirales bacterium]|nr:hypothetical protein [Nitrospirales bacterium]
MQPTIRKKLQRFMSAGKQTLSSAWIWQTENSLISGNGKILVGSIIGFGILLRFIPYLSNRSLWVDEAKLALNIIQKSFGQLVQPLDYNQMAPVGFLFIEKFLTQIFGTDEHVLRVFPLLAGILSLFLFYEVSRRILTLRGLSIALGLFALSEQLIRYASEFKQYSSDVAIALTISLMGLLCVKNESGWVSILLLTSITGALLIWFSHPSIFVLAGVGLTLVIQALETKNWRKLIWLALPAVFWLGSFALNYSLAHLDVSHHPKMIKAWSGSTAFMPLPPISVEDLLWFPKTFLAMFPQTAGLYLSGLTALCFIAGWISHLKQNRYAFFLLILPAAVSLIASGLHAYPFQGRLILFLVPSLIIFIGEGVDRIITMAKPTSPIIPVSLCLLMFLFPAHTAFSTLLNPARMEREEIRPIMAYLSAHYQEGDHIYLYPSSWAAFEYYDRRFGLEKASYQVGVVSRKNWDRYVLDLNGFSGNPRVWIVFSHVHKQFGIDEERFYLFVLNQLGRQIASFTRQGASLYLYDLH